MNYCDSNYRSLADTFSKTWNLTNAWSVSAIQQAIQDMQMGFPSNSHYLSCCSEPLRRSKQFEKQYCEIGLWKILQCDTVILKMICFYQMKLHSLIYVCCQRSISVTKRGGRYTCTKLIVACFLILNGVIAQDLKTFAKLSLRLV